MRTIAQGYYVNLIAFCTKLTKLLHFFYGFIFPVIYYAQKGVRVMLQAYQGYFKESVNFYVDNKEVTMPTNKRIIINILDDGIGNAKAEYLAKLDSAIEEGRNGEAYQYFGKGKFSDTPQSVKL